ncbi:ribosomal protein L13 [Christensenella minuta]|uniref:Large ribosomal subunit protein uL13 n=2 Tax=Christensenella minuta TaxID=626937 RepID=A0A136Q7A7_9FIRM|nr:ribosomal protein L13 [Christensenella minuta]
MRLYAQLALCTRESGGFQHRELGPPGKGRYCARNIKLKIPWEESLMKTYMAKPGEVEQKWYVVDAEGQVFGRLASKVANILHGKNKPEYTPHVDTGDYVIVINADKLVFTGKKLDQKLYYRHSGYPGGLKTTKYRDLMENKPEFALYEAVRRMLPKNKLGRKMLKKLRVYRGAEHDHAAQKPEAIEL